MELGSMSKRFMREETTAVADEILNVSDGDAKTTKVRECTGQSDRVDVLPVVHESHVGLSEADGILSLGDTVEHLELFLRDALCARRKMSSRLRLQR